MATWTVIGVYDADGEVFADHIEAATPQDAMVMVARHVNAMTSGLQILGAVEGEHQLVAACEDSGTSAWATDLANMD